MDLAPSAERRIRELQQVSPKRKLEVTVSTENANQSSTGAKRKERPTKKESPALGRPPDSIKEQKAGEKKEEVQMKKLEKSSTEPIKEMEIDPVTEASKKEELLPEIEGAACKEIIEELSKIEANKLEEKPVEKIEEKKEEQVSEPTKEKIVEPDKPPEKEKKKIIKKVIKRVKVPSEKKLIETDKKPEPKTAEIDKKEPKPTAMDIEKKEAPKKPEEPKEEPKIPEPEQPKKEPDSPEEKNGEPIPPTKPIERRRSKIFETAEKLQNLAKGNDTAPKVVEKPRKILTGVSVGGFKKEFERKASLTSTAPLLKNTNSVKSLQNGAVQNGTVPKETVPVSNGEAKTEQIIKREETEIQKPVSPIKSVAPPKPVSPPVQEPVSPPTTQTAEDEEQKKRKQNAINIISSAISKEGKI